MENAYHARYSGPIDSPPREIRNSSPTFHYGQHELRRIGEQCGNRLPPANVIQAMYLYEMQRQTEVEKLFHHQMFQLASQEDTFTTQDRRIAALENRINQMEKQAVNRDVEERLATSKTAINVQQSRLTLCSSRVDGAEIRLAAVESQLQTFQARRNTAPPPVAPSTPTDDSVSVMKEEIDVLFLDRDNILIMVKEVEGRIAKLEDNVRALTLQGTAVKSQSGLSPHAVPLSTPNGALVDLTVPKGRAHVSLTENRSMINARSFSPGKQWAQ